MLPRAPPPPPLPPPPLPQSPQPISPGPGTNPGDGRGAVLAALADALAGALGSVIAVAVFYPIDIAKTRAQASSSSSSSSSSSPASRDHDHDHDDHRDGESESSSRGLAASYLSAGGEQGEGGRRRQQRPRLGWFRSRTLAALLSIVRNEGGLTKLYEGIEAKALQALLGSFVYFYAYAFIKGIMRRRVSVGGGVGGGGTGAEAAPNSLRPSLNLLAAAMAGVVNQAFTLPLENITTRMQTAPQCRPQSPPVVAAVTQVSAKRCFDGAGAARDGRVSDRTCGGGGVGEDHGAVKTSGVGDCDNRGVDNASAFDGKWEKLAPATAVKMARTARGDSSSDRERRRQRRPRQSVAAVTEELYHEGGGIGRFWRGIAPSLILTCNPAINYTAFDILKALWIRRRDAAAFAAASGIDGVVIGAAGAAAGKGTGQGSTGGFLNPLEAFVVAAAAKSLATLVTYPLIRAKVVLMTSPLSSPTVEGAGRSHPVMPPPVAAEVADCRRCAEGEGFVSASGGGDEGGRSQRSSSCRSANDSGVVVGVDGANDQVDSTPLVDDEYGPVVPPATKTRGAEEMDGSVVPAQAPPHKPAVGGDRGGEDVGSNTRGMGTVLVNIFRREGIGGLYAGCGAQLLHTILKSALLLATKEQIAKAAASAVFIGTSTRGAAVSSKPRAASR